MLVVSVDLLKQSISQSVSQRLYPHCNPGIYYEASTQGFFFILRNTIALKSLVSKDIQIVLFLGQLRPESYEKCTGK